MAMGTDMLSTKEVADLLNVTPGRVRQFVVSGRLRPAGKLGVNLLFPRKEVAAFARKARPHGRHLDKKSFTPR